MMREIGVNLALYLAGYVALMAAPGLTVRLRSSLAYLAGCTMWVMAAMYFTVLSVHLSLPGVMGLCAVAAMLAIMAGRMRAGRMRAGRGGAGQWGAALGYLGLFAGLNLAGAYMGRIIITPDSVKYLGVARVLADARGFPAPGLWEGFVPHIIEARLNYLTFLGAAFHLAGAGHMTLIYPVLGGAVVQLVAVLAVEGWEGRRAAWGAGLAGAMLLAASGPFLYHAFYINQHMMVAACYLVGLWTIWRHEGRPGCAWLVIGAVALGATALMRTEMLFFAAGPFALLISRGDVRAEGYLIFLGCFMMVVLPWEAYKLSYVGLGRGYHDWGLLHVLALGMYAGMYSLYRMGGAGGWIRARAPLLGMALMLAIAASSGGGVVGTLRDHYLMMGMGQGLHDWGPMWWLVACGLGLDLAVNRGRGGTGYWAWGLGLFFAMRVMMYSFTYYEDAGLEGGWRFEAGSRMLLHALPVAVFYLLALGIRLYPHPRRAGMPGP